MRLATTEFEGDDAGAPLIVAHGLFGAARNWRGPRQTHGRRAARGGR